MPTKDYGFGRIGRYGIDIAQAASVDSEFVGNG